MHPHFSFSLSTKQWLIMLLLVLQIGFVNAEPLWMKAANVEHHHLLENSEFAQQYQASEHHEDGAHHCDVCHGHGAHLLILPAQTTTNKAASINEQQALPSILYASTNPNSIYRPPIASV